MERKGIVLANGQHIEFDIAQEPGRGAFFILGVRKSGSSLLNKICAALARNNGYHYVDVAGTMFRANISLQAWSSDPAVAEMLAEGNVYGGFRANPALLSGTPFFKEARKVLLLRDPRDALVSEYFSNAYSHKIPEASDAGDSVTKEMSERREQALSTQIDAYVLSRAVKMNRTIMDYESVCRDSQTLLMKYEDVILDKRKLIGLICKHCGWTASDQLIGKILGWADVVPSSEDEKAFVRKVVPGDHVEKLKPETIRELNRLLKPAMDLAGYQPSS